MVTSAEAGSQFLENLNLNCDKIRLRYYTGSISSTAYDDEQVLTLSGTAWTSGCVQPILNTYGSNDAILLEQGKISTNDKKVYIPGNVVTGGTGLSVKIGIGSPPSEEHSIVSNGVTAWRIGDDAIYKKLYLRELQNGSLFGEM